MTIRELIGILLESPFYLEMRLKERMEMVMTYINEGVITR